MLFGIAAAPAAASCSIHVYPVAGTPNPAPFHSGGPGLVLNGGGSLGKSSLAWMERTIRGDGSLKADVVFITAMAYPDEHVPSNTLRRLGDFNAVIAFNIPTCASADSYVQVAQAIDGAEGVYIDGGAQSDYVSWRHSPITAAIDRLYQRGGVVGGVSAGLAILGNFVYDAAAATALKAYTTSADAVENPYEPRISVSGPFFNFPALRNAIADTHLAVRDRLGRMTVFMARLIADHMVKTRPAKILGVGVDEGSAIVIDRHSVGHIMGDDAGARAYLVVGRRPTVIRRGQPLRYDNLRLTILSRQNPTFNFISWTSAQKPIPLSIDGRQSFYRPFNPYR